MTHKNSNPFSNDDVIKDENKEENNVETSETEAKTEEETKDTSDKKDESKNEEYSKLKADYDKLNQQYVRLAADFDNFRKRQEQERENLIKYGTEAALKKMIEVLDNFERGQKALENVEDCEKVKESFNLVHKQVHEALSKLGLEEIKAVGEEFDPNFHEAVMQTPTSEHPEHTVINELQKGYKLGDKVLRPTLVNVATAE
ncbi:MAG: nucleotide exchange factor GrpE [Candidatus Gastranaerophilaceae bacterium]|nr:nucleotide exchange factor GrpE [Cyanobacteriota bacterium]CDE91558.1 protein GrpE [Fusobacterium sp. CAG:815]